MLFDTHGRLKALNFACLEPSLSSRVTFLLVHEGRDLLRDAMLPGLVPKLGLMKRRARTHLGQALLPPIHL